MKRVVLYNAKTKRYLKVEYEPGESWIQWTRYMKADRATYFTDTEAAQSVKEKALRHARQDLKRHEKYVDDISWYMAARVIEREGLPKRFHELCRIYTYGVGSKWMTRKQAQTHIDRFSKDVAHWKKTIAALEGFAPTVIDVPIAFYTRKKRKVKVIELDVTAKATCVCCGVLIPHSHALQIRTNAYYNMHICPICIKRISESTNTIAEAFECSDPGFIEAYHTEKFIMDL